MRAIGFEQFGGPEVLHEIERPVPGLGADEVRIRVEAATVNRGDLLARRGGAALLRRPPPWVVGMEAAGTVDAVGADAASRFSVGEPVMAHINPVDPRGEAYAEFVTAPADRVARVPENASLPEAATLPMNGMTAQLLLTVMRLRRPSIVAVIGAAGAVGGYVVQLATAAGHAVIADAAPHDRGLVTRLGATVVVPRGEHVLEAIREAAGGDVDAVALTAAPGLDAARVVRPGGVVATAVGIAAASQLTSAHIRDVSLEPVVVDLVPNPASVLAHLSDLVERGRLWLRVADELPAAAASTAHRRLEAGGVRGRFVLRF